MDYRLPRREPCDVDSAELAQSNRDALDRFAHTMRNRHGEDWALIDLRKDSDSGPHETITGT